ncbi:hypothetical protein [Ktedonobacter sp. SOSP1-52]|uniref:hypothetical protein n=1 Tax=Ktedonobacter sp. SOSP1-52 TaxID=2778366 RepID=UPI001915272A
MSRIKVCLRGTPGNPHVAVGDAGTKRDNWKAVILVVLDANGDPRRIVIDDPFDGCNTHSTSI